MDAPIKPTQPREHRKPLELMKHTARTQPSEKAVAEANAQKALDDYGKKVGS